MSEKHTDIIQETQDWVIKAVIGLNLCPFAKSVHVKEQIKYVVSEAHSVEGLLEELAKELEYLAEVSPEKTDTTLLIHPHVLQDFLDYNDFLELADSLLEELKLDGELQIASFHPQYQFANTEFDDITNFTNRSPYPTLHLIREDSIDKAVEAFPEAEAIFETNMQTMEKLGLEGWEKLFPKP
ncbi:MAG: DUF1415 domain-containing protein [Polynucleobacter victoriensis]